MIARRRVTAGSLSFLLTVGITTVYAADTNPPHAENMPEPPVTMEPMLWQPGHWDWNGSQYTWAAGQYVPAAGHGNMWMPGTWSHGPNGWRWQPAHWQP